MRQRHELCELCSTGAVARAIDLAYEHFAAFGRNEDVVAALGAAIEQVAAPPALRRRFRELCAMQEE